MQLIVEDVDTDAHGARALLADEDALEGKHALQKMTDLQETTVSRVARVVSEVPLTLSRATVTRSPARLSTRKLSKSREMQTLRQSLSTTDSSTRLKRRSQRLSHQPKELLRARVATT